MPHHAGRHESQEAPVCRTRVAPFNGTVAEPICPSGGYAEAGFSSRHLVPAASSPMVCLVISEDGYGSQLIDAGGSTFHSDEVTAERPALV